MNKLIYLSSVLLVLFIASCSEDFLQVDPTGTIPSENYYQTDQDFYTSMIGIYDAIQYNYSNGSWASVLFMKNLPADDVLCAGGSSTDQTEYQYMDNFQIAADNSKITFIWTNFYKTINSCNTVIEKIKALPAPTENMYKMSAEAKALRAFTYLDLVTLFGGVPLITINATTPEEFNVPKSTIAQVFAQIELDLGDAIDSLPLKSEYSAEDKFRISKEAAQALLGKAILYESSYAKNYPSDPQYAGLTQRWGEAATVLGEIITDGAFDLEPDYSDNWVSTHEFGDESLFEISYGTTGAYDWGTFGAYWGSNGAYNNIECQLEGPRDAIFNLTGCDLGVINGWGFNLPSSSIGDLMYSRGETNRMSASLISADSLIAHGGVIVDGIEPNVTWDYEGYMRLKYVTRPTESSTGGVTELNYGTNWRIIRYADVLLMAAEAYYEDGAEGAAQTELGKVRDRAGFGSIVTETGTDLFNLIVEERQVELAFEGTRYWDLVRWNLADEVLNPGGVPDPMQSTNGVGFVAGKHEHFPIPINEIIANTAMDDSDQNPGY